MASISEILRRQILETDRVIKFSSCFYAPDFNADEWSYREQVHEDDCFKFNCPIHREDSQWGKLSEEEYDEWHDEDYIMNAQQLLDSQKMWYYHTPQGVNQELLKTHLDQALEYFKVIKGSKRLRVDSVTDIQDFPSKQMRHICRSRSI